MDISISALMIGLVSTAICSLLLLPWFPWMYTFYYRGKRLPPGCMGWPLIGESFQFYKSHKSSRPQSFYEDRLSRYGDVFKTSLFLSKTIICMDPDFNKFVLFNEGKLFEAQYPKVISTLLGPYSLVNVHGTLHKKLYGTLVNILNTDKLKKHHMEVIETSVLRTLDDWRGRETVLAVNDVGDLVSSLFMKQFMGSQPGKQTQELTLHSVTVLKALLSFPVDAPGTAYRKGLNARKRIVKIISDVMKERRNECVIYTDILGRLMAWEEFPLIDEQIIDIILLLIVAGHATTTMAITAAIKFLADSPEALQELREEHDALRKQKRQNEPLTWEDYRGMIFTRSVLYETLRVTSTPIFISRRAVKDVEVKGYTIPKGWNVIVPLVGLHLKEDAFPHPLKFNPWRWKDKDEKTMPSFMPFGRGQRYCVGSELAKLEVCIFLHHFVTKLNWDVVEPTTLTWFPTPNFKNRLPIRVTDRKGESAIIRKEGFHEELQMESEKEDSNAS